MKILYHHRIASKDGQFVHIEEMIKALRSLGHEIIVVEPRQLALKSFGKSSGGVGLMRRFLPGFIHEILEFCYSFFDFVKTFSYVIKYRPDCIYERYNLLFPSGIWVKKLFNLPFLLEINAPLYYERSVNNGISFKLLANWSELYVWKNADFVLPVTEVLSKMIQEKGIHKDKCYVIPNGINRGFLNRKVNSRVLDELFLKDKVVLGFVGFIRKWHRLDRVLDLVAEHQDKNLHLLIVGDGPVKDELIEQANRLGIKDRLTFTGVVERDRVADYIDSFDIALQPDVVEYASPLKAFEYMALGKAILAPNKSNILEILENEVSAILFDPADDNSFCRELLHLCDDEELRVRVGRGAREAIDSKKLYWDENAKNVVALFEKLMVS